MLPITLAMVGSNVSGYALTTQEIVNKTIPSVVAILPYNENTKQAFEATGWFISSNRIVTNSHVVSGDFTGVDIINVATLQKYTVDHISYNNKATDVAVITVVESNASHLDLSTLTMKPAEGMSVVMVGNPKGEYGKVTEGKLRGTTNSAPDKNSSGTLVVTTVIGGASGSPILDPNGEVVGMIWGSTDKVNGGNGLAVNIQTLTLANLASVDLNLGSFVGNSQPAPTPLSAYAVPTPSREVEFAGLAVPKSFGPTRQGANYTFTEVTDPVAIQWIASPVTLYIQRSLKGIDCSAFFFMRLNRFFDKYDISYAEAKAIDDAYNVKWVKRSIDINYHGLKVEKCNWSGKTCYMVTVPISWSVTDKNGRNRTGTGGTGAYVMVGVHSGTGTPDYFIASIWTDKD